jgi:hypothetical protein
MGESSKPNYREFEDMKNPMPEEIIASLRGYAESRRPISADYVTGLIGSAGFTLEDLSVARTYAELGELTCRKKAMAEGECQYKKVKNFISQKIGEITEHLSR